MAIAAYSVWWWLTARTLQARVDGWVAEQRLAGTLIAPEHFSVGGFPLSFSVSADAVLVKWPKGFGVASRNLTVSAHPWSPLHFKVVATHGFSVALPPGTERPAYILAGETLRGGVTFGDGDQPKELKATADSVTATHAGAEANGGQERPELVIATLELAASRPDKPPAADTDVGLAVSVHAMSVSAASLDGHPLGSSIAEAALEAQIMGPLPVTTDAAGLKAWRDAGGNVDVTNLALHWGPLAINGKGTLALDSDMQPEGAFTAHLTGWDKTIDALTAAGWIKLGPASLAKLALGVASQPDANGQAAVDTPLTIQSRRISVGSLKLGTVPELKLD